LKAPKKRSVRDTDENGRWKNRKGVSSDIVIAIFKGSDIRSIVLLVQGSDRRLPPDSLKDAPEKIEGVGGGPEQKKGRRKGDLEKEHRIKK